jgi:hypothetical protein
MGCPDRCRTHRERRRVRPSSPGDHRVACRALRPGDRTPPGIPRGSQGAPPAVRGPPGVQRRDRRSTCRSGSSPNDRRPSPGARSSPAWAPRSEGFRRSGPTRSGPGRAATSAVRARETRDPACGSRRTPRKRRSRRRAWRGPAPRARASSRPRWRRAPGDRSPCGAGRRSRNTPPRWGEVRSRGTPWERSRRGGSGRR